VFESAYEKALSFLCLHVMKNLNRDEKKMYDFRKVNPRMQKTRAKQREKIFAKQDIQKRLLKMKSELEQFEEYQRKVQQHEGSK
jgi:hypothetical protein